MDTNDHSVNDVGVTKITIGARIREERLRLGMSQAAFAKVLGVHRRTQINYESGERKPDTDYLGALANAQVDVGYVLTGESEFRKLMVLQDICGHIRFALGIDECFDAEWAEVKALVMADLQNSYDSKPEPLRGLSAVRSLLRKSPELGASSDDLADLLDKIEFVAEADGLHLTATRKAGALVCLYRTWKLSRVRFLDLQTVREELRAGA